MSDEADGCLRVGRRLGKKFTTAFVFTGQNYVLTGVMLLWNFFFDG